MDDYFERVERQLVALCDRQAHRGRRLRSAGRLASATVAIGGSVALVIVVVAIVLSAHPRPAGSSGQSVVVHLPVGDISRLAPDQRQRAYGQAAILLVRKHDPSCARPFMGGPAFSQGTPSAKLLSVLGVLRRPATSLDELPASWLTRMDRAGPRGIYVRFVRLARIAYGRRFYIAPVANAGRLSVHCVAEAESALRRALPTIPPERRAAALDQGIALISSDGPHDGLLFLDIATNGGSGGASCCGTAATIEQAAGPGSEGTNGTSILMDIIPDGVASVTYHFPPGVNCPRLPPQCPSRLVNQPRHALTVTTRPINNVLAVKVPISAPAALPTTIIWRSIDGTIIKTVHASRA